MGEFAARLVPPVVRLLDVQGLPLAARAVILPGGCVAALRAARRGLSDGLESLEASRGLQGKVAALHAEIDEKRS